MKVKFSLVVTLILFALSLAACQGEKDSGAILFSDDFSSTTSGWDQTEADDYKTAYNNGAYQIVVNKTLSDAWSNPGNFNFTDVRIEVEATKYGGSDNNDYGIICRYVDTTHFYFAALSSDGYYGILKMSDGEYSVIGRENLIPSDLINLGTATNHIRFDCVGSSLTLFINGSQVDQQTDTDYTSGNVGLIAGTYDEAGTDILFDNFYVYQP
jgi:hypothetical protein